MNKILEPTQHKARISLGWSVKNNRKRWLTGLQTLLLLIPWIGSGSALAGGFHNPDFGVRRCGMFSLMGKPDDVSALYHNPAGLTLLKGSQAYMTGTLAVIDMGMRMYDSQGVLHPKDHEITPTTYYGVSPFLGVTTDLGTERLRVAFGAYAPNFYGAFLPEDEPTRYHITEGFFVAAHTTLGLAYAVSDRFSLGAGLSLVYIRMEGKQIMNPMILADPDLRFSDDPDLAQGDFEMGLVGDTFNYNWNVGVLFRPTPKLGIGTSFISGTPVELTGKVTLQPKAGGEKMEVDQTTSMVIPFTLRAGINWEFAPDFEVGLDVFWWHYQVLQEQVTRFSEPVLGQSELRTPKNYTNSTNWSLGLLHRVTPNLEVMIGYQQDYTPIPSKTFTLDNPTTDMHGISMGARWRPVDRATFGLAMVRNWYNLIDIQDNVHAPPANVKGRGSNLQLAFDAMISF